MDSTSSIGLSEDGAFKVMWMHMTIAVAGLLVASASAIAPQFIFLQDAVGQYLVRASPIATGYEAAKSLAPAHAKAARRTPRRIASRYCPLKN